MINEDTIDTLIRTAKNARNNAYAPYSKSAVGACVLTSDGTLYGGSCIENSSLSLSMCAERVAIFKAVADGKNTFDAIAVVADTEEPFVPCGACLQVMAEFGINDVIMANLDGDMRPTTLKELIPYAKIKESEE